MRKQNSTFKTAFISEAGSELENNDYFAFVELEQYGCYVIADGLNEIPDAKSARLAIETVLLAFQENPSIKKRAVLSYLKVADKALREADSRKRLKASVAVIVTDYAKIRYGYAGNTRLFLYRDGKMKEQTQDMSLGNDLKKEKKLPEDVLARHEERNNLYTYFGQGKGFTPYVSKKIKLVNGDILALYTRGIWENLDGGELNDVFSEAKGEPQESLDSIEDLLLSRQPKELGNYTFAAIFVGKVFLNPNQKKRINKMITVGTAILTLVLVGSLILFIFYRQRQAQIANMEQKYFNTIEYIQDNNYLRAKIECEEALKVAEKLKDKKRIREIYDYQKLIEAVNAADSAYSNKKYEEAQTGYTTAKERSRYADRIADEYINKQLDMITDYRSVFDYIQLGDILVAQGDYARAEEKYLQAKSLATRSYFEEGRKDAIKALEDMYASRDKAEEADTQEAKAKASDETGAAQLASQGDKAFSEGDYEGAKAYYAMALEKYQQLGDMVHGDLVQTRIASSEQKSTESKEKEQQAEGYVKAGREQEITGDKLEAKKQYLLAKNLYKELKLDGKVTEIEGLLELLDIAAMQENVKKESKMSAENNGQKESLPSGEDSDVIKKEGGEIGPGVRGLEAPKKPKDQQ
ncbi:PP2C family serine/threonine-protein phosphatase [Lacrimispora sphenoides]|uniref:Serine/threonine protein phosphatase PrpC n=1 Tax=Lacrimispora sphenoides JCM 1415 TaxID=1297793 RepID=A0ABY1C2G6_9FIRM|nr:PP2C family serine/threonine-protein phosphatase [Lacrimispora sphenoides]SET56861.1 Serine/threonine protein phosphatase PrpC [[Clostridium] sphenoides JCM 1415]SUY49809.1 serine/threonine protein phosphatase [Lacrimispora sphenoides]